jgi:hypothetical protein
MKFKELGENLEDEGSEFGYIVLQYGVEGREERGFEFGQR